MLIIKEICQKGAIYHLRIFSLKTSSQKSGIIKLIINYIQLNSHPSQGGVD